MQQDKITVVCPHCGHAQPEPRTAFSTVCKQCHGNFRLPEAAKPAARKAAGPAPEKRRFTCFECGAELEAPVTAQSTMCKRCSRYIDLQDYQIANAVSKNFRTKGRFTVEATGYVFNTEALVGDAVIRGRFLGKLVAEHTLTIHSSAAIKGTFTGGRLIIPAENHFRWPEPIRAGSVEIAGELAADVRAAGVILVRATGRLFGDLEGGSLVVEEGAVIVGRARIGLKPA
jgi:cytoskeletal protein CcmA (bactofilin family)/DNA-directed RNA polymerase subunit RPC12/RpoP